MEVLFVPSLGLDLGLLDRLAESIDYPVKHKVAFNNGVPGALDKFRDLHRDWMVKDTHLSNLGVAGSWNYCAEWFSAESCWMLMNEDAWFEKGQLEKICNCADENLNEPVIYLNSSQAYYCFVWTHAGRNTFGTFDPNFYVAYLEDCDYRVRMRLKGKTDYVYALEGGSVVPHGKPRTGGMNYNALLQGCGLFNRTYWLKKWGSLDYENAAYEFPYKDQRLTVKDWVWDAAHRSKIYPLYEAFMSLPNPSIYD